MLAPCWNRAECSPNSEPIEAIVSSGHRKRMKGTAPAVEGPLLDIA